MRAAAVALVLILGAAVVLWYANTLNSWVLGGLIGGLAALLLSVPISLTLFSYLSRRHEERLRAEAQEEELQANLEAYENYLEAPAEVYDADAYLLADEEAWHEQEDAYRMQRTGRNLPLPAPQPRLPAARQQQPSRSEQLAPRQSQRSLEPPPIPERQGRPASRRGATSRRQASDRQTRYPGFPGYQAPGQRSTHHTAALRAARQEAAAQMADDIEVLPTRTSRKLPAVRPPMDVMLPPSQLRSPRTSRQSSAQTGQPAQYRPRPTVEGSSTSSAGRALPAGSETSAHPTTGKQMRRRDIDTEQLGNGNYYPETEPVRRQPQTGRNPRIDAQSRNSENLSGSLKNPLVRRAPYMYEDDPLRQELAQQIEAPQVRRSSRYLDYDDEEE